MSKSETPVYYDEAMAAISARSASQPVLSAETKTLGMSQTSPNVDTRDANGWTQLHLEAERGNENLVRELIERGADVNAKTAKYDMTPLHFAADQGHLKVVEILLAHQADPNSRDQDGQTPLHSAANLGKTRVAELLLAHGSQVNINDKYGRTPLDLARNKEWDDAAQLLHRHASTVAGRGYETQRTESESIASTQERKNRQEAVFRVDSGPLSIPENLSHKAILERLQFLQEGHFRAPELKKRQSIIELVENVIPNLAYIQPKQSVEIFASYHKSINSPALVILRGCRNAEDLADDLDALLQDYSVHVKDHYTVVVDAAKSCASIAVHNNGSANGRVMNVFVWREPELYRFIGWRGAYTNSTGLTVRPGRA